MIEYLNGAINWWVFSGLVIVAYFVLVWRRWDIFKGNCRELFDLPENIAKMFMGKKW